MVIAPQLFWEFADRDVIIARILFLLPDESVALVQAKQEPTSTVQYSTVEYKINYISAIQHVQAYFVIRCSTSGAKALMPCIGFELFQWVVDTIYNLKSRITSTMLLHKALVLKQEPCSNIGHYSPIQSCTHAVQYSTANCYGWFLPAVALRWGRH